MIIIGSKKLWYASFAGRGSAKLKDSLKKEYSPLISKLYVNYMRGDAASGTALLWLDSWLKALINGTFDPSLGASQRIKREIWGDSNRARREVWLDLVDIKGENNEDI